MRKTKIKIIVGFLAGIIILCGFLHDRLGFYIEYWQLIHDGHSSLLYYDPDIKTKTQAMPADAETFSLGYAYLSFPLKQISSVGLYTNNHSILLTTPSAGILFAPPMPYDEQWEERLLQWAREKSPELEERYRVSIKARDEILILPKNGRLVAKDREKTAYEKEYERLRRIEPYAVHKEMMTTKPIPFWRYILISKEQLVLTLYKLQMKLYYLEQGQFQFFELGDKNAWLYTTQSFGQLVTKMNICDEKKKILLFIIFQWGEHKPDENTRQTILASYNCTIDTVPFGFDELY